MEEEDWENEGCEGDVKDQEESVVDFAYIGERGTAYDCKGHNTDEAEYYIPVFEPFGEDVGEEEKVEVQNRV